MGMILTYKYRLLPTKAQHRALEAILESQRQLFNAGLQERIDCYRKTGETISWFDQQKELTICRKELPVRVISGVGDG
jgi:putative transposase